MFSSIVLNPFQKLVIFKLFFSSDFYGVWTYVTHTVFHASIVTVPVLAAAFLAAVPVAGQYLVTATITISLFKSY